MGFSWEKYIGVSRPSSQYGHLDTKTGQYIKNENPYKTNLEYGDPGWYEAHAKELEWDKYQQWDKSDQLTAFNHSAQGLKLQQQQYQEYVRECKRSGLTPMAMSGGAFGMIPTVAMDLEELAEQQAAEEEAREQMYEIAENAIKTIGENAEKTKGYIEDIRSKFPGSLELGDI